MGGRDVLVNMNGCWDVGEGVWHHLILMQSN